jgi:Tol biopolymer transport system component
MKRWFLPVSLLAVMALSTSGCAFIARVSVSDDAPPDANGDSLHPAVSADGRYEVFSSTATNIVKNGLDTNGVEDVFERDLQTGQTRLVSFARTNGFVEQADGASTNPSVSADGRFVAFESDADNLVANDTNGVRDVFVADMQTLTMDRVSVNSFEKQFTNESLAPSISDDGRYVAFESAEPVDLLDNNGTFDIFVRDRLAGTTDYASMASGPFFSVPNDQSFAPVISGDGTQVAFASLATDIVSGDTNGHADVFERNLVTNTTTRVSVANNGAQLTTGNSGLPSISEDGRYVAFSSDASDVVAGDTNSARDVFVRDTVGGTTQRVSVSSSGAQATGTSDSPSISGDGRFVVFQSNAPDLVSTDTNGLQDIFVRDRTSNVTQIVSTTMFLDAANGPSQTPAISRDGRTVAFATTANNLDPKATDGNGASDVYTRATRIPTVTSITPSSVTRGTAVPYTITGDGFLTNPNPSVQGPSQVTFTVTTATNTSISGTITVGAGASTGLQTIYVGNPGTGAGQNTGAVGSCKCLTVN